MRKSILLALALMLSACSAYAFGGPGSIVVDIVGSVTDNTKITSSGMEKVELEIIGSEANNTIISPPEKVVICPKHICPDTIYPECEKTKTRRNVIPGRICIWESMPGMALSGTQISICRSGPNSRSGNLKHHVI